MSGIVLRILMDGLIALVPGDNSSLTALVVDGIQPPVEASGCVGRHTMATLKFTFQGDQKAGAAACKSLSCVATNSTCTCTFDQKQQQYQVSFVGSFLPSNLTLKQRPDQPTPLIWQQAQDPSYVLNLQRVAQLDRTFLTTGAAAGLLGRMQLPYTNLTACNLALLKHDSGDYFVHEFNLRKISDAFDDQKPTQAMAQAVIAEADLLNGGIKLVLSKLTGEGMQQFDLATAACGDLMCADVVLSNHRGDDLADDDRCVTQGKGFDFAFYYQLTKGAPGWVDRPVPQSDGVTRPEANVAVPACGKIFKPHASAARSDASLFDLLVATSRPVCAMVFFNGG
jgi:hypothetical protein